MKAVCPPDESERVRAVRQYNVLDTPPEAPFDELTWLAAEICRTPKAILTLIDERRQWFKSRIGISFTETPIDIAFCKHTIQGRDIFEVPNAREDRRFADNPLVTRDPSIQFYAGAPLISAEGFAVGSLTVIDVVPRRLEDFQRKALQALAHQAVAQLELRRVESRTKLDLEKTVSLLRAALESTADGLLVVDRGGKIISYNQRFIELWRIPEEIVARHSDREALQFALEQLADPDEFIARVYQLYEHPEEESFETISFKDGRQFERYSRPQRIGDEIAGRVWSFRDVTQRKKLETQLRQAQKMEALGRLSGGIAHDFNNLLHVIVGYAALLEGQVGRQQTGGLNYAAKISKAAQRAADLTRQLLTFSRHQMIEPEVLDVNDVLESMSKMLPRIIGEDIALEISPSAEPNYVVASRPQIEQVIMNLVVNARDAMPEGGKLSISTQTLTLPRAPADGPELAPGTYAVLAVSDTGTGMSEEVKAHIFEPFFTTKPPGKGTGLGLATVYGIVKQNRGDIRVESAPGRGARFEIYFPVIERQTSADIARISAKPPQRGSETVLLVEDEDAVRDTIRTILQRHGYTVISARNAEEALRTFSQQQAAVDLVITNIIMPGMRGVELARRLHELRPKTRVLYISGYADTAAGTIPGPRLQKPFTPDALLRKVRDLLAA